MSSPSVWLLDVDGVINADRPGWGAAPRVGRAYAEGMEFRIQWAPALIRRIRRLHSEGRVEIRWATTWCAYADQIERLLGLPEFGRSWTDNLSGQEAVQAKLRAARAVLAEGRRLVWADDEVPSGKVRDELVEQGALLIAPRPRRGLQPVDLDLIEAFLGGDAVGIELGPDSA